MNEGVERALKFFGIQARSIKKPLAAKLTSVFVVDDRYLLRSRRYLDDTERSFAAERELLPFVRDLTGFEFPRYQPSEDGRYFFVDGPSFWTLHRLIPGQSLGNWYELHCTPPDTDREVMIVLRQLHDSTTGRFAEASISRTFFSELLQPALTQAPAFLTDHSLQTIRSSFQRMKEFAGAYRANQACFVHGDFHHGNVLANNGKIVGFVDLDWCRVGHAFEDLGFTMMMLVRDYRTWSTELRWQRYHELLSHYRFDGDPSILNDYMALYALFDCSVFKSATFEAATKFYEYQKTFLETLCETVLRRDCQYLTGC
jgi:aminoglycoside phosphotransferase (APT) family kinase protein